MRYEKTMKQEDNLLKGIKSVLVGTLVGSVICVLLLMFCAFMFVKVKNIPQAVVQPLSLGISAIGAFAGGYISSRIEKEKGLLYGAITGVMLFLILFMAGLIMARNALTVATLIKFILLTISGALGGIVGVNRRAK